jgi:Holliday junction DNA helicase RuvA
MISKVCGKITERGPNYLIIDTGPISYEVFVPQTVMQGIDANITADGKIDLLTFHYLQVEPAKSIPVLIGFLNEVEKDFFEIFITVSGIGPKGALRALNKPISEIASAIDEADINFLKSLPGIGEQRAREIVAKLQNKVGKFGLIKDSKIRVSDTKAKDIAQEALAVLMQLEYKKSEAQGMVKRALESAAGIETTEELLNIIYKQRKNK